MRAQSRSRIVDLLARHGVAPIKRLGQNFLADPNIIRRIVELAEVGPGDRVVEIGAGTGSLTRALAGAGAAVLAFEVDEGLRRLLMEETAGLEVDLRFADITKIDLAGELGSEEWKLVANLPYNVGTPLILDTLRHIAAIRHLVVMVQREVADRLVAAPGSPAYGLPSVVVGLHADARIALRVPPQVFVPAPRVESAVVVIRRRPAPQDAEQAVALAAAAFSQRRKMLRRSLALTLPDVTARLEAAGIDPTGRAEDLSAADFLRLARS